MAFERRLLCPIISAALFFLSPSPLLWAQDVEPQNVRLAWAEDENSLRYEVVVEKEEEGTYQKVLQEFTGVSSIELSLPPGNYRCHVIPYDFLEKPGEASQWISFEVRAPRIPEPRPDPAPLPFYKDQNLNLIVSAGNAKMFDVYIAAAWMPLLPLYGEENRFFGKSPSLLGAALRFGALYSRTDFFSPGLEVAGSWYTFKGSGENGNPLRHAATAGLNFLGQLRLPSPIFAMRFRLGAGLSFAAGGQAFHANLGASFIWFAHDNFFLEAGLDYAHMFTGDPSGCLRPWLGAGWQF